MFNYQGVARDNGGNVLANQNIGLQLSVLSGSISGTIEYTETHNTTTNALGLFNVSVGAGTVQSGVFSDIDWAGNSHFISVEMDASGGTSYTLMGTSQLLSVPYALSSADNRWGESGSDIFNSNTGNVGIGVNSPGAKLEVAGQVKITGGSPGTDKVLTSGADGLATWEAVESELPSNPTAGDMVYYNGADWQLVPVGQHGQYLRLSETLVPTWDGDPTLPVATVTSPETGRVWMDRNLGASQVATSIDDVAAFGDYYQWGRDSDGHEKTGSSTTTARSVTDTPGHANFIMHATQPNDWRLTNNDNLWQGVNGINNPCPLGFRIPTKLEWEAEFAAFANSETAGFDSFLKLPSAGYRDGYSTGDLLSTSNPYYWTSTTDGSSVYWTNTFFGPPVFWVTELWSYRAAGVCVRCIQD